MPERHDLCGRGQVTFSRRGAGPEVLAKIGGQRGNVELIAGHDKGYGPLDQADAIVGGHVIEGEDDHVVGCALQSVVPPFQRCWCHVCLRPNKNKYAVGGQELTLNVFELLRQEDRQ